MLANKDKQKKQGGVAKSKKQIQTVSHLPIQKKTPKYMRVKKQKWGGGGRLDLRQTPLLTAIGTSLLGGCRVGPYAEPQCAFRPWREGRLLFLRGGDGHECFFLQRRHSAPGCLLELRGLHFAEGLADGAFTRQ